MKPATPEIDWYHPNPDKTLQARRYEATLQFVCYDETVDKGDAKKNKRDEDKLELFRGKFVEFCLCQREPDNELCESLSHAIGLCALASGTGHYCPRCQTLDLKDRQNHVCHVKLFADASPDKCPVCRDDCVDDRHHAKGHGPFVSVLFNNVKKNYDHDDVYCT